MRYLLVSAALLLVAGANELHAASPRPDARQMYDGTMRPDEAVQRLAHADELFPVRTVRPTARPRRLSAAEKVLGNVSFGVGGKTYDLYDYVALNRVVGLLVLKNGLVVHEEYELGIDANTHWPSFSIAKSVTSTLIGAAVQDGKIKSLDDPVTKYLPQLRGSAYEGVSVRNVLQMASGVAWDETYTDPTSDRRRLLEVQLKQQPGSILAFMSALHKAGAPGSVWNYNSGETFIAGALLEAAVGKPLATYLQEKIWQPWGMESDARWWCESVGGVGWGGGGLEATLRDFGRFGEFVISDGIINGQRVVPKGWFDEAGSSKRLGEKTEYYGYLWWIPDQRESVHSGAFEAMGIFGQRMYVNRREHLVVVVLSARPKPSGMNVVDDDAFFAAVAKALH